MEVMNDCPETFNNILQLPKPITGLNIWPPSNPNVTTQDIYEYKIPISYSEVNKDVHTVSEIERKNARQVRSNRGPRRGEFVVNPEWLSEDVSVQRPMTARLAGKVYEPNATDFFGARDLHSKTWEQARVAPGHGSNTHQAIPGYAPYKYEPLEYRTAKADMANSWPWNRYQQQQLADQTAQEFSTKRPHTAVGTYFAKTPESHTKFDQELNDLHAIHVGDKMNGGKPDIETREFTRSNREIMYGVTRSLDSIEPYNDSIVHLPQPYSNGGHRYLTDLFATTYSRNLPQMMFRKAQHAHAPWHAYMTFCDWGEPPLLTETTAV